ncbi:MAG: hypothetical protein IJA20_02445 [Methanocorpusculum sp.]|nr:hypothetical protein [Oscillospiraceae bacterium]MBQ3569513.1 hypothetical protein [Methanocorpusculum sp.]
MQEYRRVMVKRYGFAQIPADSDTEALEEVKSMSHSDFDWGDVDTDDAEVIDVLDEHGNSIQS